MPTSWLNGVAMHRVAEIARGRGPISSSTSLEAVGHPVLRELCLQRARHATRDLVVHTEQTSYSCELVDEVALLLADALEVSRAPAASSRRPPSACSPPLDVRAHALGRGQRRSVGHRARASCAAPSRRAHGLAVRHAGDAHDVVRSGTRLACPPAVARRRSGTSVAARSVCSTPAVSYSRIVSTSGASGEPRTLSAYYSSVCTGDMRVHDRCRRSPSRTASRSAASRCHLVDVVTARRRSSSCGRRAR